jgi:hypothetical protein
VKIDSLNAVPTVPPLAIYEKEVEATFAVTKKKPSALSAVLLELARPETEITEPTGGGVVVTMVIVDGVVVV